MLYRVWCRKRTEDALWFDMPYAPRDRDGAEALIDYYVSEWGGLYEYEVVPVHRTPSGRRAPCFVGHN